MSYNKLLFLDQEYLSADKKKLFLADCLIEVTPNEGEHTLQHAQILEAIRDAGDELALVLWPPVQYFTGQVFQMEEIISTAHEVGAFCGLGRVSKI